MTLVESTLNRQIQNPVVGMSVGENERRLVGFYSNLYRSEDSDSPDSSRASLLRRAHPTLLTLGEGDYVLDLGSGKQILERSYLRDRKLEPQYTIITVDFAEFHRKQLLGKDYRNVQHFRANGARMPFRDQLFSFTVSSLALDFMPEEAMSELYRVMRPGSWGEINLHHLDMIPTNLQELLRSRNLSPKEREVLEQWDYLQQNKILTNNPGEIEARLRRVGFFVDRVEEARDRGEVWWEVGIKRNDAAV